MNKVIISTNKSPKAIGPYSQAIKVQGGITFTSGQIPLNLDGNLVSEDFEKQVYQVLKNINGILEERDKSLSDIVKLTVFLVDLSNFDIFKKVFEKYFNNDSFPARSVVEVSKLPKNSQVEIEAIFNDN